MAIALVPGQSVNIGSAGTSTTTLTASLPNPTAIHHLVTAKVAFRNAAATFTAPANWASAVKEQANGLTIEIWYLKDCAAGLQTFQFNSDQAANAMGLIVAEWSGADLTAPLGQTAVNTGATSSPMDSGTIATTTDADALWLAAMAYNAGGNRTLSGTTNGFTQDQNCTTATDTGATHRANISDYYKIVSATGSAEVSETLSSAANWVGCIATFKAAAVVTPIDVSDTAALTDTPSVATVATSATEAGTLGETISQATIAPSVTEPTASGADAVSAVIAVGPSTTAAGSDTQGLGTVLAPVTETSAAGAETVALGTVAPAISTTGVLGETPAVTTFIPATNAMTAYLNSAPTTTLSTAGGIIDATNSGVAASKNVTIGTATGIGEMAALGSASAWPSLSSIPAPTGKGWLWDVTTLEGNGFAIGDWTPKLRLQVSAGSIIADFTLRFFVYNAGTYTQFGSAVISGITVSTVTTNFSGSAQAEGQQVFNTGDKLYIDCWPNITTNSTGSGGAGLKLYSPSVANTGIIQSEVVTAGWGAQPAGPPTTVSVSDTAVLGDTAAIVSQTRPITDVSLADTLIAQMFANLATYGWISDPAINSGLGGLYVNWRYGTVPLQVNMNGTGSPDVYPLPVPPNNTIIRHDRLTDLRYVQNLCRYQTRYPSDHTYDAELTKYIAILKGDFTSGFGEHRGWVYDIFYEIYIHTGDSWFATACQGEADTFSGRVQSNGMIYDTSVDYPQGYYLSGEVIEEACALIHAGTIFTSNPSAATWVTQGYGVLSYVWSHAYLSQWGVFCNRMYYVLMPDLVTDNPDQHFGATLGDGGGQIKTDYTAQIIISLLHAYAVTSDATLLAKAQALLVPLDSVSNPIGWWDTAYEGYIYWLQPTGASYLSPGTLTRDYTNKKEAGRQIQMLDAYVLANQYTSNAYLAMQQVMLRVMCTKAYYAAGQGVLYEVNPNWSLYANAGAPLGVEDWVTTEAMGIALNGLLAFGTAVLAGAYDAVSLGIVAPAITETGTGATSAATGTTPIPLTEAGTGATGAATSVVLPTVNEPAVGADAASMLIATPITEPGTGTTTQGLGTVLSPEIDAGVAAETEVTGITLPTINVPAVGAETPGLLIVAPLTEAGTGTTTQGLGTVLSPEADTGALGEALGISATAPVSDQGLGGDAQGLGTVLSPEVDTGVLGEAAAIENTITAPSTDVSVSADTQGLGTVAPGVVEPPASGAEGVGLGTIQAPVTDAGTLANQATVGYVTPALGDTAVESDHPSLGTVHPVPTEPGTGTTTETTFVTPTVSGPGTGGDQVGMGTVLSPETDTGVSDDQATAASALDIQDTALGQDAVSPIFQEPAVGLDEVTLGIVAPTPSELGIAGDQAGNVSLVTPDVETGVAAEDAEVLGLVDITEPAVADDQATIGYVTPALDEAATTTEQVGLPTIAPSLDEIAYAQEQATLAPLTIPFEETGVAGEQVDVGVTLDLTEQAVAAETPTQLAREDYGIAAEFLIIAAHWRGPRIHGGTSTGQTIVDTANALPILTFHEQE